MSLHIFKRFFQKIFNNGGDLDVVKKYKVLNPDLTSPFQGFIYELGRTYHCEEFDPNPHNDCSHGFYATDIEGILYTNLSGGKRVFEVEVWGVSAVINAYKQRFEYQKIIREIPEAELRGLVYDQNAKMDWNFYNAVFPINPLELPEVTAVGPEELQLLKEWAEVRGVVWDAVWDAVGGAVWDAIWDAVGDAVGDAVWDAVGDAVWDAVGSAVWDAVYGYIASLFPNVDFGYDFSSAAKLWNKGLVPSFDGEKWRLHSGKSARIVWEGVL